MEIAVVIVQGTTPWCGTSVHVLVNKESRMTAHEMLGRTNQRRCTLDAVSLGLDLLHNGTDRGRLELGNACSHPPALRRCHLDGVHFSPCRDACRFNGRLGIPMEHEDGYQFKELAL